MSTLRIDSERFIQFATTLALWRTHNDGSFHRDRLDKMLGYKRGQEASDYAEELRLFLRVEEATDTARPFNDPLPDDMEPDPKLREPQTRSPLPDLDMTEPMSIWQHTRRNNLYTEVIADYMLRSGWDYIDHRLIHGKLRMDADEVRDILEQQLIEERYLKDCDHKFVGLMELIFKAFHDWWKTQHQPKTRKVGDPA